MTLARTIRPGAANEEDRDDAGEASGADSAKTPGAQKAAAVSGLPPYLAFSVSGQVRRTPRVRVPDARCHVVC